MNRPRRVLSLATLYPNAQMPRFGTFVARSLEALARRGDWDVTVINPIGLPPLPVPLLPGRYRSLAVACRDGVELGVMVHRPRFPLLPLFGGPFNPALITRAVLPLARRLHEQNPFDLIDAQFFYPDGPAARNIATALGLPFSIKARGADIHFWGHGRWTGLQVMRAGRAATGLLAVSQALADDMASLGLSRDKVTIHYTGLDRDQFRPIPRHDARTQIAARGILACDAERPLLVTVGALIARKGQEFVIRALLQLPDAMLAIVGTGPDEARLRQLTTDLGIAGRVAFLGSLDHEWLPVVLASADAMVLPSASEGLANAWVEALACGTPIVITEAGGARELVPHDGAGRIVAREPHAIAQAVQTLLASPPDPLAVSAMVAHFSWEAHAERLACYFEGLVQPSPRAIRS